VERADEPDGVWRPCRNTLSAVLDGLGGAFRHPPMKVYKHYRPRDARTPLILMGLVGLAAMGGLVWTLPMGLAGDPPFPIFVVILAVLTPNVWILAHTALEARLDDDGYVEFVAPLGRARISVLDILSIAPSDMMQGKVFILKHRGGKLRFDPKLTGMHELIARLETMNPQIELRGI
jgi:hypothetical protein